MSESPPQHESEVEPVFVPLEGSVNFRDLGGYPTREGGIVRHGRLFRSDGLHRLTTEDVSHLREEVRLRAIVDLRSTHELDIDGRGPLEAEPIAYHHNPLFDESKRTETPSFSDLGELYFGMARHAAPRIGCAITLLTESEGAAVFHCAAGKDRTGVISALVLGFVGVDDAWIAEDYGTTRRRLDQIRARLHASKAYAEMWDQLPADTLHAEPATMHGFLERVRAHYGSLEGYAEEAGLTASTLDRLREALVAR